MAQDLPPTFGRDYPDHQAGQGPAGYDQQQSWYPQQQGHDGGAGQHVWYPEQGGQGHQDPQPVWHDQQAQQAWQHGVPEQYETDVYGNPVAAYGGHGSVGGAGDQGNYGFYGHGSSADHGQGHAGGYDEPGAYQDGPAQQLYASSGAESTQGGHLTVEPAAGSAFATSTDAAAPADGSPSAPGPDPAPGPARRGDAPRSSLAAKARAAADAVISADHAPAPRALAIRAGAGIAALAVLVTAGLVVSGEQRGGDSIEATGGEKGFTVAHAKVWAAAAAADAQQGADDTLVGGWLLDNAVVRADSTGLHAYDLATGKPIWTAEPPAQGAALCGLAPSVNAGGLGAALFRPRADPKSPCTLVTAVDTRTGKTAWTKTVSDAKDGYTARIAVTDDKVIAVGDDKALAWEAADGKDVWQYTGQGRFCTLSGGAQGKTVVIHSSCADSTPVDQAVALNTADGKVSWWRGLNNQPKTVTVLSAEPAAVLTTGEKPAEDRVFAWGQTGDPAAEIPVGAEEARLDAGRGAFSAAPGVFFQDRTMIGMLTSAAGGPVSIAAYDLNTGKQVWATKASEKGRVRAVGLDKGALVLAADERVGQPAHLSRFGLTGGQETVGGSFPEGTGSLLISGRVMTGGGRTVVVPEHSANFGIASAYEAKD
ncbi:PQQ-binding-like beta-propeller repeat protein [Kitasatospora sp. NPDC050543]|uniref:outer membrane protein assembly factor BamB family protein n=1 Tax=Kitasatospora sp. NPDC050543 TaxID=3364054 RepID=UPI0037A70A1E